MTSLQINSVQITQGVIASSSIAMPKIEVPPMLKSSNGLMLTGGIAAFAALSVLSKSKKKKAKLATSYFGGHKEKRRARKTALKQIQARKRNAVALYLAKPQSGLLDRCSDPQY